MNLKKELTYFVKMFILGLIFIPVLLTIIAGINTLRGDFIYIPSIEIIIQTLILLALTILIVMVLDLIIITYKKQRKNAMNYFPNDNKTLKTHYEKVGGS